MRYEDSPVKAPPPSRRRMTPPTPLQNSYSSFGGEQEHYEVDSQIWRAREKAPWRQCSSSSSNERQWQLGREEQRAEWSLSERRVMGAVEDYLEGSADIQVDIEALERFIEPEDEKVCLRYILKYSTRRGSDMFKLFDTKREEGPSRGKQKALGGTPNFNFPTRVFCGWYVVTV